MDGVSTSLIERAAMVALLRRDDRPWPLLATEVLEAGSASTVLRAPGGQQVLLADDHDELVDRALTDVMAWEGAGIGVHSVLDDSYPALLRDIRERPPILFTRGQLSPDDRAIAVVGSRRASDDGLRVGRTIARELVGRGVTVVSGLAEGIDTAAHQAALDSGGRTVAVIGTGINQCYPRANRPLQDRIGRDGLVLSQFWPDAPPRKEHFPMRNAVMSGYSAATVVVEAGEHSGVRIQARLALQHGRQVIIRDTLLALGWARELAEKPGVHVVHGIDDLLRAVESVLDQRRTQLASWEGLAGILG